jgi:hypothetical protein
MHCPSFIEQAALPANFCTGKRWLVLLAIATLASCGRARSAGERAAAPAPALSSPASTSFASRTPAPMPVSGSSSSAVSVSPRPATECPAELPQAGSRCEGVVGCTFEETEYDECNVYALCLAGVWQVHPKPEGCPADNLAPRATCPKKAMPVAGFCNKLDKVCHVGDTLCTCKACVADRCDGEGNRWICLSERRDSIQCPDVPPALGAPCSESVVCDYGYWEYGVAKRRICEDGRWIGELVQRE